MKLFDSITDTEVITLLKNGSVGLIPTDTVYGLACDATNQNSIEKIYNLKERSGKPGTVIAANIDQLEKLGLKRRYLKAVEEYWPGPVSILIPCSFDLNYLTLRTMLLAVRIPDDQELQDLLLKTGPLLTSSANKTGKPPITNIESAKYIFKDELDFYVDGGDYSGREASALIKIVDDAVEVIRPGNRFK